MLFAQQYASKRINSKTSPLIPKINVEQKVDELKNDIKEINRVLLNQC